MRLRNAAFIAVAVCATHLIASDLKAVHEWGTFTSVAGTDGAPLSWQPLSNPSDLPCFVHRLDQRNLKAAAYGTVRMETPVLYFYPLKPASVSVFLNFPGGRVTEWYPQASGVQPATSRNGWIEWDDVHLDATTGPLPTLGEASHYYAARETDSAVLQSRNENEKLLFYRGIADFDIDLRAVTHDDAVSIRNEGAATIPEAILFQNHQGKIGYSIIRSLHAPVTVKYSALTGTLDNLRSEWEEELIEMGLYPKEASAMLATWRDSWFEEGLRIFYVLPRSRVDALLPISIQPPPGQLTRVFVGRVELLSPQMKNDVGAALLNSDLPLLKKYGRFLDAFLRSMSDPPMSEAVRQFLDRSHLQNSLKSQQSACTN